MKRIVYMNGSWIVNDDAGNMLILRLIGMQDHK
jgi:hypothetical protein